MAGSSSERPRQQRVFRGVSREDVLRQATEDAAQGRASGYVPISQTWSEESGLQVLTVLYEQQLTPSFVPGGYPISVRIDRDRQINRLWGIPFIGIGVRAILVIPHLIVLWLYSIAIAFSFLVTWIPILFTGHMPHWVYSLIGGYLRLLSRVSAYVLLFAIPYPGFGSGPNEAFDVTFDESQRINNLWGIPFLGVWLRSLFLIPSVIVLWFVGIAAGLVSLVTWIPVLINGRYPDFGYDIVGGYLRWSARLLGWFFMLAGPYPPFRLSE